MRGAVRREKMTDERFSVYTWFPDDSYFCELDNVDAEAAVKKAKSLSTNVGARTGIVHRITIVDSLDNTVFEWQYGKGVTFL